MSELELEPRLEQDVEQEEDLEQRISALSPQKRRLLELMRRKEAAPEAPPAETPRTAPFSLLSAEDRRRLPDGLEDAYPLTQVQLGMLFHMAQTTDASTPTYHNVNSLHVRMPFDPEVFQEAVDQLVAEREVFRVSFDLTSYSEPLQLVHRAARLLVDVVDLRHLPEEEQQRAVDEFIREENRRLVDLAKPPLIRYHVHRRADDRFQFTLTEPHAISDGWSTNSSLVDLVARYRALLRGETPPPAPRLGVTYRDFVALEREALRSEEVRSFWQRKLSDSNLVPLPRWPAHLRPAAPPADRKPTEVIPHSVFQGLLRLTRVAEVPYKSVTLAAHLKVMSLLSGSAEVVTGLTTNGRPEDVDGDQVRGLFLNTLPLRFRVPPGSWADLARTALAAELELMPYRRYPLAALQRLRGGQPLFESGFSSLHFHNFERADLTGSIQVLSHGGSDQSVTHFPLGVTFQRMPPTGLVLTLELNDPALTEEQGRLFHGYYRRVLEAMADDPHARHDGHSFLSERELHQVLVQWNPPERSFRTAECLHEIFARQARRNPEAVAVTAAGGASLTYGELDRLSSRLARRLRARGVGPESLVGVCLERSSALLVTLLGVLKAGGAYVPLDPAYPKARLDYLLEDSGARLVVTEERLLGVLSGLAPEVLCLDGEPAGEEGDAIDLPSGALPASPAYVIYTSGSTGNPKGVVVTHENVTRLFAATREWFDFGASDVWTLFHSFAFDFSVWEMWGALLHGGRLVVVPYLVSRSPAELYRLLREEGVTVLNQTPSAFRQLLQAEAETPAADLALRQVVFGGEALDPLALKPWLDRHGDERPRLINMYGITETTVHVTYRPIRARDLELGAGSWIGGPIPDLRLYCLDPGLLPVPAGVPGEIHVGGAGLARGYLGRPALTAERFVPDPFGAPGARLYRSGDLARFLPDGELEYLGRADHQVKIRGFRIELGEIESALREHPLLREAAVLARQDEPGEARLAAYVVPRPGAEPPSVSDLRAFLAARLPEHAVPSAFVVLDELPLTVNGKLDRRALPAPDAARPDLAVDFVAPRNAREQALAEIWAEVLGVERVGVHDNFFSLGGDSIRSIQVIARARERRLALDIQQLFQHPTVATLAEALTEAVEEAAPCRTAPFELVAPEDRERLPADLEDAYPLTRLQAGMLFHMDLSSELPLYHNVETYHLEAPFAAEPFREALRRIVARHPVLRTSFDLSSWSEPLQLVHRHAETPLEIEDLRGLSPERQEEIIAERFDRENRTPFDLSRPPQWRLVIHRRTDSTFQLTFAENHAIFDGWSLYSTLAELFRHYSALLKGSPLPEEPPPSIPFREFVALEREMLRSAEAQAFWSNELSGSTFLQVPLWRPVPPPEPGGPNMRMLYPPVPPDLMAGLQRFAAAAGLPLKNILLAAHLKVLARLSGQDDVVTGLVMNGRAEAAGGEETRGLFLNTVPFRLRLPGGTWADLARGALAAEQRMLPFRRYPVSELQNQLGGQPLFQTIFNYTHFHVIQGVAESGEVFVRGYRKSTETNFTLGAGFSLDSASGQLTLEVAGSTRLMPPEELEAIASWYGRALAAMAADPQARHDGASLLSAAEIHQILAEWNDTAGPSGESDGPATLHELFERSAARDPEAVAVVGAGERITYGELESRANRLAQRLRSQGVRPGVLVGIYLDRSPAMIPALLGVLKAGGAYVPLASGWPASRIEWILGEHGVRHLVTENGRLEPVRELQQALPELVHVTCVDDPELETLPPHRPQPLSGAGDLAYIIFTSGSTGRPKGVMVRHQPVVNLIAWVGETFAIGPADRVLFITALSFDLSVYDVFGLLAAGGSIHVASSADLDEPERLVRLLRDEPITFWDSAPAALQQLVPLFSRVPDLAQSRLRLVFLSGDWIPLPLPDLVREAFPAARVISLGGATEATIWSNWHPVGVLDPRWVSIPYGRPIRNARYHVLDGGLVPAPAGAPGDLYIGGGCLSSGYAGEPALTAERYLPDPFGGEPGGRIYRTGDRARHWPDGTLEFLGRLDQQVKIRGYRIELGEIEAALARHPEVRDACVLAREDVPGQRRLVAYVVPHGEAAPDDPELRRHLQETLPEYMVPAVFVTLGALPVTPNGKLDRAALPAPEAQRSLAQERTPPRNALEQRLVQTWSELLGIGDLGIHENFFQIGGHSLIAIQLVTRLRETFQVDLPLRTLFDNPTVAELAAIVAQAGGPEAALLAPALPDLVPQPEHLHEPFPLTDLQQAYWLGRMADFQLGNVSAHIYEELNLPELDAARFETAWRRLIDRHPMLRARVLPDGRQQILPQAPAFHVEVLDLRGETAERAEAAIAAVRRRMSEQGPDLSSWPLFEVRVSRLDERRHHVHVSLSLLLGDAISGALLTRELMLFYADPDAALPPVEVSFRDYVLALAAFEESEAYQRSLRYWTERVPALPPAPELPVLAELRSEPRFVRRTRVIDAAAWERLKARAGQAGVTPTVAVLAAYSEVLAAWSKSPRFTLNLLFFNRFPVHPQIQQVVGNFSSTTLLEVDAARGDSFETRAVRLQEQLWKDLEHSRVTGVRVLREIARHQGASARPAMPVVFTSDIGLERGEEAPQGASVASWGALQTPHVWLDHQVSERQGRLILNWDVVENLFPAEMADEMFEAYCGLVAALAEPDVWQSKPPRLVPAAHLALQAAANATEAPLPEGLLHSHFLRQAHERPDAPAVLAADRTLTYGELLREASRVAHRLRHLGARPGALVAVVMEKGWEQIAGALGVLLSGAAYLPIDPQVPGERLRFLLDNGEATLALTQSRFAATLDWPDRIVRLPLDTETFEDLDDTPPPALQRPDDLAYVIFTSGSTGLPKGVAIEHRAALNTILDINQRFDVGPDDRVLALSALNFDLSVYDLFGLLAAGGALVLPDPASLREPARWAELMSAHRVTLWNSVPALMEMLVDDLEGRGQHLPATLRLVLLSGDWIPVRLPDRLRTLAAGTVDTVSLGGATEASIWSILHPIAEVDLRWTSIPYGRPMASQTFHVLGPDLQPRPVWVPGELYIGGAGLAREYWRDEERTQASFVTQPDTGERLYRTGDLGRWLPDGQIEFLGREDLQVKIQGYRIELGEIEAALSQHPGVRLCAVAALGERQGSKRLVAWYVPDRTAPDATDLTAFLGTKLPPYMIPTAFVELDEMPLTPNGKVDRRALSEPERGTTSTGERIPPRDELETHLAALWQDLLGVPSVGIRDSFFDLGGHSLLAVRLMSRLRTELGRDLPLATLFEASTIETLAALLRKEDTGARTPLVLIRRGEGSPLFLVHPVGGSVLCYRDLAQALEEGPIWALQSPEAPPRTLEDMATAYLTTLRTAQPQGPYRLAGWSMGGTLAYEMARQLRSQGEDIDLLALIDASVPGAAGPVEVDDATLASWFARDLGGLAGRALDLTPEDLRGRTHDDQLHLILERAIAAGALPPDFAPEELSHHLDLFRHNYRALLTYVPGTYPGPLLSLVAEETPAEAAKPWHTLAARVEEHRVPGDHYTVVQPPQVEELARRLRGSLEKA